MRSVYWLQDFDILSTISEKYSEKFGVVREISGNPLKDDDIPRYLRGRVVSSKAVERDIRSSLWRGFCPFYLEFQKDFSFSFVCR